MSRWEPELMKDMVFDRSPAEQDFALEDPCEKVSTPHWTKQCQPQPACGSFPLFDRLRRHDLIDADTTAAQRGHDQPQISERLWVRTYCASISARRRASDISTPLT